MKDKILQIVDGSSVSDADKELWRNSLTNMPEEILTLLAGVIEENKDDFAFINSSFKKKLAAMNDPEKMRAVVAEEKAILADAAKEDDVRDTINKSDS